MPRHDVDFYTRYYLEQAGSGYSVYRGSRYQRGHGIASFFKGLFRAALPMFKSGARAIGHEVLRSGANVLTDISENKSLRQSLLERATESGRVLKRKAESKLNSMSGNGLKGGKRRRITHSSFTPKQVRTVKRSTKKGRKTKSIKRIRKRLNKNSKSQDIFS